MNAPVSLFSESARHQAASQDITPLEPLPVATAQTSMVTGTVA
jgi:hypothetical protein